MNKRATPFIENIAESGAACLVTMVQGNLLVLGLSHWLIASQTGLVAGTAAAAVLTVARIDKRWLVALILGVITAVVDFFIHPGMIGPVFGEALITGAGAAALSYAVGFVIAKRRSVALETDLDQQVVVDEQRGEQ